MSMKNPIDTIGKRTRHLPSCSPLPITPPREPMNKFCHQNADLINFPVCGINIWHSNLDGNLSSNFKLEGEAVG